MVDLIPALMPIVSRVRTDTSWCKIGRKIRRQKDAPLTQLLLREHLRGVRLRGVCPMQEGGSTTRLALLDLDSHQGETEWPQMQFVCAQICEHLEKLGYPTVAFRSSGGKGIHVFIVWDEPQEAYAVRDFLRNALKDCGFKDGTNGVKEGDIEIFPKQNSVPIGGFGNQFILPLGGKSTFLEPLLGYEPVSREKSPVKWPSAPAVPLPKREPPKPTAKRQHYEGDLAVLKTALEKLDPNMPYEQWFKIGMGLHAECEGDLEGLILWDEWSARSIDKYPGTEQLAAHWRSFRTDKDVSITAGFIKKLAWEQGWREDYSADFEHVKDTSEVPKEAKKKGKKNRFRLVRADEFAKRKPPHWLIKGVLPQKSTGMTYGASGDGKTFAILDMACAVARGHPWNGRKVKQGHVVYICAEGSGGFITRLKAYCHKEEISLKELGDYLAIIPAAPNFTVQEDVIELITEIKSYNKEVDLIIIDTLAQTMTGGDENSAKDTNLMFHNLEIVRDACDCAAHLIHHAGKDEARGARGSSNLKAPCDVQIQITRDGDRRLLWIDKMKDGQDKFGWHFTLDTVLLDEKDEDGETITSCAVKYEETLTSSKAAVKKKHGTWETLVLKAWEQLGGGTCFVEEIIDVAKTLAPYDSKAGDKDRRREYARRALQSLSKNDELTIRDDKVIDNLLV